MWYYYVILANGNDLPYFDYYLADVAEWIIRKWSRDILKFEFSCPHCNGLVLLLRTRSPCRLLKPELPVELQELMSDLAVGDSCCMWEETGPASSRGTSKKGTSELFCWCAEAAELCWAASAAIAAMCRLAAACRWKFGKKGG